MLIGRPLAESSAVAKVTLPSGQKLQTLSLSQLRYQPNPQLQAQHNDEEETGPD